MDKRLSIRTLRTAGRHLRHSPFSLRGLLIGAAMSLAVGLAAPYGLVFEYFRIGFNPSSQGAIFFFLVLLVVNVFFGLVRRQFTLSRADLVLVYCMLLMAVTVPTWGLMFFLLGTMVYPYYYATSENRFAELFHDHIPSWMVPQDMRAIQHYYEGLPRGATINWPVWIEPLAYWFALIMVMSFMLFCVSTIHRQWSVHERLAYPMMQLPQAMIEKGEGALSTVAPLFRRKLMWFGFALPMFFFSLTGLHHFFPSFPEISYWGPGFTLFREAIYFNIAYSFAWVGFFYLVNLEISFSIWFFYMFCKLEEGVLTTLGVSSTERLSAYEVPQSADLTHQATGAVIVFILFGLWSARRHIVDVLRKAWNPSQGVDDSEELLRYRTAVIGFVASLLFVCFWLWRSGVPAVFVPILVIVSLHLGGACGDHGGGRHDEKPDRARLLHHIRVRHLGTGRERPGGPQFQLCLAGRVADLTHGSLRTRY